MIRLDALEKPSPGPAEPDREGTGKIPAEEKREKMINEWIADLGKRATVKKLIKE